MMPYLSAWSSLLSVALNWICSMRWAISRAEVGSRSVVVGVTWTMSRCADQRNERRIGGVTAVPIGFAVELDGVVEEGQAGRREHRVDRQLLVGQDSQRPVAHPGRAEQELDLRPLAQDLEVHFRLQRFAQRVHIERIELIGRHQPHDEVEARVERRRPRD
jgi:hypothetical protein